MNCTVAEPSCHVTHDETLSKRGITGTHGVVRVIAWESRNVMRTLSVPYELVHHSSFPSTRFMTEYHRTDMWWG